MRQVLQLLLLVSLLLTVLVVPEPGNKGGKRGRRRKNKRGRRKGGGGGGGGAPAAIKTCSFLENCHYPIDTDCLRPFDVAERGRTILYGQARHGIVKSGTKSRDKLGSLILFSGQQEVLQLQLEIELATHKGMPAAMHAAIYQSMCGDWEVVTTSCDPALQHEEYFPLMMNCEAILEPETHYLDHQTLRFETKGVFLKIYINDNLIGKVALPHEDCVTGATRVKINNIAFTGAPRGMAHMPLFCN